MGKYDVVIIGGGPAGLRAAQVLARAGKTVVVLEKADKLGKKVCAGGLARRTVKTFSIPAYLLETTFNYVLLSAGGKKVKIEDNEMVIGMISRPELTNWLAKVAESQGARILLSHKVTEIGDNYVMASGKKFSFLYLVGADGSNSLVRKVLKLKTNAINVVYQVVLKETLPYLVWHYAFDQFGSGYGWIFPHRAYTAIGCGCRPQQIKPGQLRKNFLAWLRELNIAIADKDISAAILNLDYRGLKFGPYFLVGDAAGLASPLTREGIYSALVSGEEAARAIINPDYSLAGLRQLLRWRKAHLRWARLCSLGRLPAQVIHYLLPYATKFRKIRRLYFSLTVG